MQVLFANLMKSANDATLNHRPKAVDGIGMNRPTDIFALAMMDNTMIAPGIKMPVTGVIIGRDQADFVRNGLIHEAIKGLGVNIINDLSHDLATSTNSPDNRSLATGATAPASLVLMLVLGFAAYKGFVNFHKANELAKFGIVEARSQTEGNWLPAQGFNLATSGSTFEVAGHDYGVTSGFSHNFNLNTLAVTGNLQLVDLVDNGNRSGIHGAQEALYVNSLTGSGTLDLHGFWCYVNNGGAPFALGNGLYNGVTVTGVAPIPGSVLLMGPGLMGLGLLKFRRRERKIQGQGHQQPQAIRRRPEGAPFFCRGKDVGLSKEIV